ncbi:exodeoxyribonuclease III [Hirschia litorea]|uniref:Exodeoxyribonuclease III n=1 Tax=Hirschia litorea TaxID=1199156 RepID=A0ABW2IMX4_9PROT
MTDLRLTSWNINSVRLRMPRVADFIAREKPDILCLQEIKCREAEYPLKAFEEAGMPYVEIAGQKGMHGVAIGSKYPIERLDTPDFCMRGEARALSVKIAGIEIHNLYVPAGGDEPDPVINEKFAHKLEFLARMEKIYAARCADSQPLIVVGDINVAPGEHDVWSHKQLLKVVSHTPVETDALDKILKLGGFSDIGRLKHDATEKLYSWWSYRARDWEKSNRGRRLDHIWANQAATPLTDASSYEIHQSDRGGEKPSDHAPVTVNLKAAL